MSRQTTITKRYHFEAAHFLPLVAKDHKCCRMHGHNYKVDISIMRQGTSRGAVQPNGFILDFWDLDKIVQPILDRIDHRVLNDIKGLTNPTAEIIADWFMDQVLSSLDDGFSCSKVVVYETDECFATVVGYY